MNVVKDGARERAKAKKYWDGLSDEQRGLIGDALVLGGFDFREWGFETRPSRLFMNELDELRVYWEQA